MASPRTQQKLLTVLKLLGVLTVAGVLAAGLLLPYVGGAGIAASKGADKFLDTQCDLTESALAQTTNIYANDGTTLIASLFTNNRIQIPLTQIPTVAQKALIDTEDRRFYEHHGIDTRGLLRALLNESNSGNTQGASTLTQQYVKQVRYYQAKTDAERADAIAQNGDRKIYEAKCALELEKKYSKAQILEKYFNIAYFGEQSYGIQVAARNYFGTTADQLTVPQAAVLVGLVKDPTLYDPFQNPANAKERRDEVIQNMVKAGDLSQSEADTYKATPVRTVDTGAPVGAQGCSYANEAAIKNVGFFCDYVVNWIAEKGGISREALASGGFKVVTSLDANLQNEATTALQAQFPATSPSTVIQPAIDPQTGEIKAFVTSKLYDYGETHDGDAQYTTNPIFSTAFAGSGSTYKYFALIAALTAGFKPTATLTASSPYATKNCGRDNKVKSNLISNAGTYNPTLTLRDATVQSSNTFFVALEDQLYGCDMSTIVNTAVSLGMNALNTPDPNDNNQTPAARVIADRSYTFTLGQESTSALELSEAYGVAANDGVYCQAKPVLSITTVDGKAVNYTQPTCTRQMSTWVARTAVNIMTGDTTGGTAGGQFFRLYNSVSRTTHLVAGKTGTNNGTDAAGNDDGTNSAIWFVGLTPRLVASSAIVNVDAPTKTIRGLPGYSDGAARTEAFGAISSIYWIASFKAEIARTSWTWPAAAASGVAVPSVVGLTEAAAIQKITAAGFQPVKYPIACAGTGIPGTVNYSGPEYADPGSPVNYCMASGKALSRPAPATTAPATPATPATPGATAPAPAPAPTR